MPARLKGEAIEVNAATLCRLLESAYRCTLCRRCAQTCPMGVDNALLTREIRKLFSMELGIAPKEIHDKGSMLQLRTGSSTGMKAAAVRDNIEFLDDEIREQTGLHIQTPWDKEGADVLLIHNAGEILAWPENPMAFAILLETAGISWTMSSDLMGYDSVNYGLWYDDVQFARVAVRQAEAAKKLKVKKIVLGECGHGHKASMVTADRMLSSDLNIPRESALVLLRDIVTKRPSETRPFAQRLPSHASRSLQHGAHDGHCGAAARNPACHLSTVSRDGSAWRRELLLRWRLRFRHHVWLQLRRLALPSLRSDETETGAGCLRRLPRSGDEEVRLRALLELQRPVP